MEVSHAFFVCVCVVQIFKTTTENVKNISFICTMATQIVFQLYATNDQMPNRYIQYSLKVSVWLSIRLTEKLIT